MNQQLDDDLVSTDFDIMTDEMAQYSEEEMFELGFLDRLNLLQNCCIEVVWQTAISARFAILAAFLCHFIAAWFVKTPEAKLDNNRSAKQQRSNVNWLLLGDFAPFTAHCLLGFATVYIHFDNNPLPVVSLLGETLFFYFLHRLAPASLRNYAGLSFIILFTCLMEFVLFPTQLWHSVRGCHMILTMKLISLLDTENQQQENSSSFLSYLAYCSSPATVIYGPWLSYSAFSNSVKTARFDVRQWIHVAKNIFFGIICLVCSTCALNGILFSDEDLSKFVVILGTVISRHLIAVRDSYSFILSNFFISYLSTVIATTGGMTGITLESNVGGKESYIVVSRPFDVLVPHSLTLLVIAWSVPMHTWLRRYVFRPMHRNFGPLAGVLSTYTASALLHGFNAQIAIVLLTVGVFTYVEFQLRSRLAKIFDACIGSRPCEDNERDSICHHKFDLDHPVVRSVNVAFSFYTVALFAYATACFGTDTEHGAAVEGYSFLHLLTIWSRLNWYGHAICLVTFIFDYVTR